MMLARTRSRGRGHSAPSGTFPCPNYCRAERRWEVERGLHPREHGRRKRWRVQRRRQLGEVRVRRLEHARPAGRAACVQVAAQGRAARRTW